MPIKVDREERPDVDRIYMTYVQATTGSGGWPMSVWLTPDLKPFFGGTYFPPDNRYGRPGFARDARAHRARPGRTIATRIVQVQQRSGRRSLRNTAGSAAAQRRRCSIEPILDTGLSVLPPHLRSDHGGFGDAPKFPRPVVLNFLLRYYARTGNEEALDMVLATLRAMAKGGMHDQLGGGFHRYSVDECWFVPHFEKMLYDQAQLAISYLEAFQITRDPFYAGIARSMLDYVLRDMTHPEGGFYSAEDADSVIDPANPHEKGEGAFYIWTCERSWSKCSEPATRQDGSAIRYGVEAERQRPQRSARRVHRQEHSLSSATRSPKPHRAFDRSEEATKAQLEKAHAELLEARSQRVRPHLDDKILTAWNGLMISAFAKAAQVLDEPRYLDAARRAAEFILARMYDAETGTTAAPLSRWRRRDRRLPRRLRLLHRGPARSVRSRFQSAASGTRHAA